MKPFKFDYDQRNISLQNCEMDETKKNSTNSNHLSS